MRFFRLFSLCVSGVCLVAQDNLFAAPAVGEQGNDIALGATGGKDGGLFADHLGGEFFEAIGRGVFTENYGTI